MKLGLSCTRWYAIQVRPKYELYVVKLLTQKGYEGFTPISSTVRHWSDRKRVVEVPLFTGYVFCRFNPEIRVPLLTTPGVMCVLGGGTALDDAEVEAVRAVMVCRVEPERYDFLEIGMKVRVIRGPLTGVEGFLVAHKSKFRLVLSVSMVQNSISIEVERHQVTEVGDKAATLRGDRSVSVRPNNVPAQGLSLPAGR